MSSKTVKVVVGPPSASVEYTIHEDLLKKHSDFAIAAMNGQWRESDERTIYLMDDEPALFELFADFVYSGEIYYRSGETGPAKVEGGRSDSDIESELSEDEEIRKERVKEELFRRAHSAMECLTLGRCYLLGDKLLSNSFKAAVADAIAKKISSEKEGVPLKLHLLAYNGTSGNNGFKRLVVDIGYCVWDEDNFKDVDCVEYLRDVTMQLRRYQNYPVKRDTLWRRLGATITITVMARPATWRCSEA